jgi:hypothetical protein
MGGDGTEIESELWIASADREFASEDGDISASLERDGFLGERMAQPDRYVEALFPQEFSWLLIDKAGVYHGSILF